MLGTTHHEERDRNEDSTRADTEQSGCNAAEKADEESRKKIGADDFRVSFSDRLTATRRRARRVARDFINESAALGSH